MSHIWPVDDALTEGALLPSFWPSMWIPCDVAPTPFNVGGLLGKPTYSFGTDGPLYLHDGMSANPSAPVAALAGGSGDYSGFLWREFESTSVTTAIQMAHYIKPHNGGNTGSSSNWISQAYVCARVSGGSIGGETAFAWGNEYWISTPTNGYFFGISGNGTDGSSWILFRIKAGVVTTLAQTVIGAYSTLIDPTTPHFIRMAFADGGSGTLDIACSWGTGSLLFQVFNVNDASPIAGAGRCGFVHKATVDNTTSGYTAVIPYVRIDDSSAVHLLDEWQRRNRDDARVYAGAVFTDQDARDMRTGWTGDYDADSTDGPWMRRGSDGPTTPGDRVMQTAQLEPVGSDADNPFLEGFMLSQRLADYEDSQHRRIRVHFSSLDILDASGTAPTGDERRWAGVLVRSTEGTSLGDVGRGGYLLQVSTDDDGTYAGGVMQLWRLDTSGTVGLLIATATPTVLVDTDYTVALQAFNVADAGSNPDGNVILKAYLDGVQVVLGTTSDGLAAGITDDGAGTIVDGTSGARRMGSGEGMRIAGYTGTRCTFVDAWTQLALGGTLGTGEQDQATVALETETDDYTGQTLTLPIEWPVEEVTGSDVESYELEKGHRAKVLFQVEPRRRWRVLATAATTAEKADLLTFWDDHDGIVKSFSWVPPLESVAIKAHFMDQTLGIVLRAPGVWAFDVEIEELFE